MNTTVVLHTSPADPAIVTITTPEGDTLTALGAKTEDGVATSVDTLVFNDQSGNQSITTINSNNNLPERVTSSDGTSVMFVWNDELDSVQVTGVSSNGDTQATINVDLLELNSTESNSTESGNLLAIAASQKTFRTESRRIRSLEARKTAELVYHQSMHIETSFVKARNKKAAGSLVTTQINVESCNIPEPDAQVFAIVRQNFVQTSTSTTFSSEETLTAFATGTPGQFKIRIPSPCEPGTSINNQVEELCMEISDTLDITCREFRRLPNRLSSGFRICREIETAVDEITEQLPGVSVNVFRTCLQAFFTFNSYCSSPFFRSRNLGDTTSNTICSQVEAATDPFEDLVGTTDIFLQPYAIFPSGNRVDATGIVITLNPGDSGPLSQNFVIPNDNTVPEIILLTVNPPDPAPGEDYVATATLRCTTDMSFISMTIVGSDGFQDSNSCSGAVTVCVLNVPGAAELVRDVVTVTVTDSSQGPGFQTSRVVSIVF